MTGGTLERPATTTGRRRAEKAPRPRNRTLYLAMLVVSSLACVGAWFFLVKAAIDFGRAAAGGRTLAWGFTVIATLGGIGCLLLMFVLVSRLARQLGVSSEYKGRRSSR